MLIYSIFWKVLEGFSTKSGVKNCWKTEDRTAERQHNQHWPNMGPHNPQMSFQHGPRWLQKNQDDDKRTPKKNPRKFPKKNAGFLKPWAWPFLSIVDVKFRVGNKKFLPSKAVVADIDVNVMSSSLYVALISPFWLPKWPNITPI